MKILIAPNSMKGSLNAFDFADTVEKAFKQCSPDFDIRKVPVADGGDFTGEVLKENLGASEKMLKVVDPLGKTISSKYSIAGNKAIVEMADASGMKLLGAGELNPLKASSFGTGQLIDDAIKSGCTEIYLAIGGSATVDGGMGMMEALGFNFYDHNQTKLSGNGGNLQHIHTIEKFDLSQKIVFKIICDVDNPLLGKTGAAEVFGPQKGATPEMVEVLEKGLENWADILTKESGKDLRDVEGAGAAGGMALPLMAFFDAEIVPGADFVLQQLNFDGQVKWADIVITGEGKIDSQTLNNKAPFAVAKVARKYNKPVFAIGGKVENTTSEVFDGIFSLVNGPLTLDFAMNNAKQLLYGFSLEFAKTIQALVKLKE
ncbi:glycerate kinase [Prolixibacteraceae bacterium Z1-6]|uniref:Glycerate kinase n=1 Tax=Draconibacterium aestuarii TaxID=2998507 RepID=A0A9X3FAC1_9BACT|nr:glycerate kinase [Prolixibacteraceae bacterium Z1-6]